MAIDIGNYWAYVKQKRVNDVWRKIWLKDVVAVSCVDAQDLEGERQDISEMAEQAGCEEVDGNITEILSYTDKNY
jgi:hypothetical protein